MSVTACFSPERVRELVEEKYAALPKTGKPQEHEFTVLAAVVVEYLRDGIKDGDESRGICNRVMQVCSLGTGLKCIGGGLGHRSTAGESINDSHAEVIARRAFVAWIYSQLFWCLIDKKLNEKEEKYYSASAASNLTNHPGVSQIPLLLSSVADSDSNSKYQFRSDVSFHFFVTCGPCGCATDDNNYDKTMTNAPYNLTQVVRKPGRGVETLSVSCSDKFAKWSVMGAQGSNLMRYLTKPVYFDTLTVMQSGNETVSRMSYAIELRMLATATNGYCNVCREGKCKSSEERKETDIQIDSPFSLRPPRLCVLCWDSDASGRRRDIHLNKKQFVKGENKSPSGVSIVYSAGNDHCKEIYEVTLAKTGRKAGTAKIKNKKRKKNSNNEEDLNSENNSNVTAIESHLSRKTCSSVCKAAFLSRIRILEAFLQYRNEKSLDRTSLHVSNNFSYAHYKTSCQSYQSLWSQLCYEPKSPLFGWKRDKVNKQKVFESFSKELEDVQVLKRGPAEECLAPGLCM